VIINKLKLMDKIKDKQVGIMPTYRYLFPQYGAVGKKSIIKIVKTLYLADCLMILYKLSRHYCKYIFLSNNYSTYRKYCLELLDEKTVGVILNDEIKTNKQFDIIFPEISMLHLIKLCLKYCDCSGYSKDDIFPLTLLQKVGKCLLITNDIMHDCQSRGSQIGAENNGEPTSELLVNFTKQIIADKRFDIFQKLYQTLFLFKGITNKYKDYFDLDSVFIKRYGVNVDEYLAFLFLLYSQFIVKHNNTEDGECPYFNLDVALQKVKPKFKEFILENLILEKGKYKKIDLSFYNVLEITRKPLIEVRDKNIIPISLKRLFSGLTEGVYFDVLDGIEDEENKKIFSTYFGYSIEDYFSDIVFNINNKVIPSFKYGKPETETPDAILVEGNNAIFFECKKRQFHTLEFLRNGNSEMYFNRINEFCFKPLDQICKRVSDFRNKKFSLPDINNDCMIYPVIVSPEAPPLFSGAWDMFKINDRILPDYYKEDNKIALPEFIDFAELEVIEAYIKENPGQLMVDLIKKKRSSINYPHSNWTVFLYNEGIYNINKRLREKYQSEIKGYKSLLFNKSK